MVIGNVISESDVNIGDEFQQISSEDLGSNDLPTLIIGLDLVKSIHNGELDFLERKIGDNVFWTFSKIENREYHEQDVYDFIAFCYTRLTNQIKYFFVDFIQFDKAKLAKIFHKLNEYDDIVMFLFKNMAYLYSHDTIFGIDISQAEYLGYERDKLVNRLKKFSNTYIEGKTYLQEYSTYLSMLNEQIKYIPYLHYLQKQS